MQTEWFTGRVKKNSQTAIIVQNLIVHHVDGDIQEVLSTSCYIVVQTYLTTPTLQVSYIPIFHNMRSSPVALIPHDALFMCCSWQLLTWRSIQVFKLQAVGSNR